MTAPVVLERAANVSKKSTVMHRPKSVCFVCTGNTCRSPMAEAVTNDLAKRFKKPICATSAGLYAVAGEPIAANAALALENAGIEAHGARNYYLHRAHTLCSEEAERSDLIIGLSDQHAMELLLRYPALADRITCFSPPINDPFGGDLACYERCLCEITDAIKRMLFSENL